MAKLFCSIFRSRLCALRFLQESMFPHVADHHRILACVSHPKNDIIFEFPKKPQEIPLLSPRVPRTSSCFAPLVSVPESWAALSPVSSGSSSPSRPSRPAPRGCDTRRGAQGDLACWVRPGDVHRTPRCWRQTPIQSVRTLYRNHVEQCVYFNFASGVVPFFCTYLPW